MKWWKYISFAQRLLAWYASASADGVIDKDELLEVTEMAIEHFDIDVALEVNRVD